MGGLGLDSSQRPAQEATEDAADDIADACAENGAEQGDVALHPQPVTSGRQQQHGEQADDLYED